MTEAGIKRCVVAYSTPERCFSWELELPAGATIADALATARQLAATDEVPWDTAQVGIYGELRARAIVPADGDRIEIYRPLANDPRERRRQRVRQLRGSG